MCANRLNTFAILSIEKEIENDLNIFEMINRIKINKKNIIFK